MRTILPLLSLLALAPLPEAEAQAVFTVDGMDPTADFTSLPQAVAAVPPDSVLRVAPMPGSYGDVTIAKPLAIVAAVADPPIALGDVTVGRITVEGLPTGEQVLLRDLRSTPTSGWSVRDVAGAVWLDGCEVGHGLVVERCGDLVLTGCGIDPAENDSALFLVDSTATVRDSKVTADVGATQTVGPLLVGLEGPAAILLVRSDLSLFDSEVEGGGPGTSTIPGLEPQGGPAIGVATSYPALLFCETGAGLVQSSCLSRGNLLTPGTPPTPVFWWNRACSDVATSPQSDGHTFDDDPAALSRRLEFADELEGPDTALLRAFGAPGDAVLVVVGLGLNSTALPGIEGPVLPREPWLVLPLGTLDAQGEGSLPISFPSLPGYLELFFAQGGFYSTGGQAFAGGPVATIVIG